jgi:hypothetical protein
VFALDKQDRLTTHGAQTLMEDYFDEQPYRHVHHVIVTQDDGQRIVVSGIPAEEVYEAQRVVWEVETPTAAAGDSGADHSSHDAPLPGYVLSLIFIWLERAASWRCAACLFAGCPS